MCFTFQFVSFFYLCVDCKCEKVLMEHHHFLINEYVQKKVNKEEKIYFCIKYLNKFSPLPNRDYQHFLSQKTSYRDWYRRVKKDDFDIEHRERCGAPLILMTINWKLAKSLGVNHTMVSKSLKTLGSIRKQITWVPYKLPPRH